MNQEELIIALKKLFEESLESVHERERTTFDRLVSPYGEKMVLFGTGGLGRKIVKRLKKLGIKPLGFCDNNSSLWGKDVEGVTVYSPEDAVKKFADQASFVVTIWSDKLGHPLKEVRDQLQTYGEANVVSFLPLFWKYSEEFLPEFFLDLPSKMIKERDNIVASAYLISDSESRSGFYKNIKSRYDSSLENIPPALDAETLFRPDFVKPDPDEVFLDAGAYDGDTIRLLLSSNTFEFQEIIALEPDPKNYGKLVTEIEGLPLAIRGKINALAIAVGSENGLITFDASGTDQAQISSSGGTQVECVRIDDAFVGKSISFIKMDIEGAEPEAIMGAIKTIAEQSPVLAVSVYHRPNHLWNVASMLCNINSAYSIYYRPHAQGGWDYILYAVPQCRENRE
jgi:FkbM family methyltransferase